MKFAGNFPFYTFSLMKISKTANFIPKKKKIENIAENILCHNFSFYAIIKDENQLRKVVNFFCKYILVRFSDFNLLYA